MALKTVRFIIKISLQTPIITHTTGAIAFGLDTAMHRDHQDRPCLPGSLIKGNLRHAWEQLAALSGAPLESEINKYLGSPSEKAKNPETYEPQRGTFIFSDNWSDLDWKVTNTVQKRYRIRIDESTGAVAPGALQVIESPYPVGNTVVFSGYIDAEIASENQLNVQQWLQKGLEFIPALGAHKGTGCGKVEKIVIDVGAIPQIPQLPLRELAAYASNTETRLGLRITPDKAFCFAKPAKGENNYFETENCIPGGAIIAALARQIKKDPDKWPQLNKQLDKISITQACPVTERAKQRPVAIPLSLAHAEGQFQDIAHQPLEHYLLNNQAPEFLIDWKDKVWDAAHKLYNPNNTKQPEIQLALRTAIDPETQTAADQQLFSMEVVCPQGFDWLANLNLSRITDENDRQQVIHQLHELLKQPLTHLGKTKTSASVKLENKFDYSCLTDLNPSDQLIIYLQTPARLLPTGFTSKGTNQQQCLQLAYAESWKQLSGGALSLQRFHAQQHLLGGNYWWSRFRKTDATQTTSYHPEIFTSPGSVFVLKIEKEKAKLAQEKIQAWSQQGLPQLEDTPGGEDWQHNPWINANGYGEIAINIQPAKREGATHG